MPYADFEKAVIDAKSAHKERLEEAGNIGAAIHDWIEHYTIAVIAGDQNLVLEILSQMPHDERAENGCRAFLDWVRLHNVRFTTTEQKVFSREFDVSGTLDGIALTDSCGDRKCCPNDFADQLTLIDYKSSNFLHLEYILQLSFYWRAHAEEHGTQFGQAFLIRLGKEDGEFETWHLETEAVAMGLQAFKSALALTRDMEALEARHKARKEAIAVIRKAEAEAARELKRRTACDYSGKFKGTKPRMCHEGGMCLKCAQIYLDKQVDKMVGWVWIEWPNKQLGAGDAISGVDVVDAIFDQPAVGSRERLASLLAGL
jgi:hypothetical protein